MNIKTLIKQGLCVIFLFFPTLSAGALTPEKQKLLAAFWNKKQEVIYPTQIPYGYSENEFQFTSLMLGPDSQHSGNYSIVYREKQPFIEGPIGGITLFFDLSKEKLMNRDQEQKHQPPPICSSPKEANPSQRWSYYFAFLQQRIYFCAQPVSVKVTLIKKGNKQTKILQRFNVMTAGIPLSSLRIHAHDVRKEDFAEFMSGLGLLNN
ncbi:MAG: hypothetical protein IV090_14185 [Candidatus Sericytochromatia bacterium]|nr:hypothetical protein [Candidatus Sericytochromatia bacterium]